MRRINGREDSMQYFIISKEPLSELQYLRLKQQINDSWPKDESRPILLEGELTVTTGEDVSPARPL